VCVASRVFSYVRLRLRASACAFVRGGSGVTASLPSATTMLDFLADAIADAHGSDGLQDLLDTPIGTMASSEVPVPTHARMSGATAYEVRPARQARQARPFFSFACVGSVQCHAAAGGWLAAHEGNGVEREKSFGLPTKPTALL